MAYVFDFEHKHRRPPMDMKDLLGGKGANLAEMTSVLGLPVPHGFTISTDACRAYMDGGWPTASTPSSRRRGHASRTRWGSGLGDPADPLLVSVRSGAKFSMPGMMDTVLNLGSTTSRWKGWPSRPTTSGSPMTRTGASSRCTRASCSDVPGEELDTLFDAAKELAGTTSDAGDPAGVAPLPDRARTSRSSSRHTGKPFPQDPDDQLRGAIEAVFRSWNGARAVAYRSARAHPGRSRARRSTCRRWCSATATSARAREWGSPATRRQARRASTATS